MHRFHPLRSERVARPRPHVQRRLIPIRHFSAGGDIELRGAAAMDIADEKGEIDTADLFRSNPICGVRLTLSICARGTAG